jgi:hypothetical protein
VNVRLYHVVLEQFHPQLLPGIRREKVPPTSVRSRRIKLPLRPIQHPMRVFTPRGAWKHLLVCQKGRKWGADEEVDGDHMMEHAEEGNYLGGDLRGRRGGGGGSGGARGGGEVLFAVEMKCFFYTSETKSLSRRS